MSSSISLLLCSNKRCFPGFKNVTRLNTDTFYLLVSVLTGFDCMFFPLLRWLDTVFLKGNLPYLDLLS